MKVQITSKVPTVYQLQSIQQFGMVVNKLPGGSFYACKSFRTKREAREYLKEKAVRYFEDDPKKLKEALRNIRELDFLEIDAATAKIEPILEIFE